MNNHERRSQNISYAVDSSVFPVFSSNGDEFFVTDNGLSTGLVKDQFIFDGQVWIKRPSTGAYTELVDLVANTTYTVNHNRNNIYPQFESRIERTGKAEDGSVIDLKVINRTLISFDITVSVDHSSVRLIVQ